jgi:hypothetical protein
VSQPSQAQPFRVVNLPQRKDPRGSLGFAEVGAHIPFSVLRVFYLYGLAPGAERGAHAHLAQHQFLVMLHGSCTVVVDDGRTRQNVDLASPAVGLHAPPLNWLELKDFSADAACMVLASGHYDESDYIRDYERFRKLTVQEVGSNG